MDSRKLKLLIHTIKYLRFKQIYYRGYYFIRNRFFSSIYHKVLDKPVEKLQWEDDFFYTDSYNDENSFEFLNISHEFGSKIDWNYDAYGKLWTYNLNYFDFLNQQSISSEEGIYLIEDYVVNDAILNDGKEPYPISLRGINWIKFLAKHSISNAVVDQKLYDHYQILLHNLEYHLLGNHLLENAYSLLFGAYYFKDDELYIKAKKILKDELTEQVLNDGAHYELSPMYHQILLHRLLDCLALLRRNLWREDELYLFLEEKASKMISWLQAVTFADGNIPMVNDSAFGIAPNSKQLLDYAIELGLEVSVGKLSDSGYRKLVHSKYELFVDVGDIGPTYQPGHAHSDTFNFELYVNNKPVIVDTGISTYEKNQTRQQQRETAAHNTVKIGNVEQSQVWGGFRVAKRARVNKLEENETFVKASHNGYRHLGVVHTRSFTASANEVLIEDFLDKKTELDQLAFVHFHPSIREIKINDDSLHLVNQGIRITFESSIKIEKQNFEYAMGFNKTVNSHKIAVSFKGDLRTRIIL